MKLGTDDSKIDRVGATVDTTNQLAYFEFGGLYRLGEGVWGADWQEGKQVKGRRWFPGFHRRWTHDDPGQPVHI